MLTYYPGHMDWTPDVTPGDWLAERLDDPYTQTMHSVVPHGFEAYARVFHVPMLRTSPTHRVPSQQDHAQQTEVARTAHEGVFTETPTTWAEAARAFGGIFHPLAQWRSIVKPLPEEDWWMSVDSEGRGFQAPAEGQTEPELTTAIVRALIGEQHPVPGFAALWEGHGGLVGAYGTTGRAFFTADETTPEGTDPEIAWRHQQMLNASTHDPFNNVFQRPAWQDGILSREISEGQRFELPQRNHVLFAGDVSVFTSPDWITTVPWTDHPAQARGFAPSAQTPSLIWPADHSWVVVNEVDYDSTIVCGSREAIDRILGIAGLESAEIPENSVMFLDGDTLNP